MGSLEFMYYIISLVGFIAIYLVFIMSIKKISNITVANISLIVICLTCYIGVAIIIFNDVGFYDWNFQNVLPTANVSPFMFATLWVYFILPQKFRGIWSLLIALLSLGMFAAVILGCIYRAIIQYKFHLSFLLDFTAHFSLSLLGIYFVKSKQVELNKRSCLLSGGLIVIIAFIMMIINIIFGTAFFGLALNDGYNIYNMVIVPNCYLSAILYFLGLVFVLILGYFYLKIFDKQEKV